MMKVLAVQIVVACFPVSHWSRGRHGVQCRFGWLTACAPALGTCSRITRMPCCNSTRSWEMAGHRDVVSGIAMRHLALQHSVKERPGGNYSSGRLFHIASPSKIRSASPASGN